LVLALKLAELKLIEEVVGEPPLLLLDDVLAELDPNRQNQSWRHSRSVSDFNHYHSFEFFDSQWLKASQIFRFRGTDLTSDDRKGAQNHPLSVQRFLNAPYSHPFWRYQLLKKFANSP